MALGVGAYRALSSQYPAAYRSGRGDLAPVLDARRMELDLRLQQITLEAEAAKAQVQIVFYDQQ
jgi:outer membrane protein TolC